MGYRSRAVFKLQEIQRADRLIRPGMTIVDLGAAPGGWSQLAVKLLQGDFSDDSVLAQLEQMLGDERPQLVMSDMAPNTTGIADVDHDRSMHLVELSLEFARQRLRPGGDFLVKVFQGRHFQPFVKELRASFGSVKVRKPDASRQRSPELYLLGRDFKA